MIVTKNKGLYGLCNHNGNNLYIYKKIRFDEGLSHQALIEIDILRQLKYINLLLIQDKQIILLLPFINRTLRDVAEDKYMPTSQKLPILYKITSALDYLHQHNILYLNMKDSNILLKEEEPLLIDFTESIMVDNIIEGKRLIEKKGKFYAPELLITNNHNEKTDIWALGMLIVSTIIGGNFHVQNNRYQFYYEEHNTEENVEYQSFLIEVVTNNLVVLLQNVSESYRDLCINLLNKIFDINQHHRPTAQEILQDKLFVNCIINNKILKEKEKEKEKEVKYLEKHRDILKLLIQWTRELYPNVDIKLLFLAIDLYNKIGCFFINRTNDELMNMAITVIWIAGKIISQENVKLDEHITMVSDIIPNITKQSIIMMEIEIIQLLEENIAELKLYHSCSTVDQLSVAFEDIIMNKDSSLYLETNIEEWIALIRNTIADNDNGKMISIKDFFG